MEKDWSYCPWLFSELSGLRDGGFASAKEFARYFSFYGLELRPRAIVASAKVCWVVDYLPDYYCIPGSMTSLDSRLRFVNAIQASLNDWFKGGRRKLLYSIWKLWVDDISPWEISAEEPSIPSYAVVASALLLVSLVYQYLTGNVDRGGSKAYSRSSLDFRDIYVAIVLFLGAYVWIKFREAALKGVHPRTLVDKQGGTKVVYDARLTPPQWNGKTVPKLELGRFATPQEAHNQFRIAAFYYNRDAGLLDGWFQVPPMRVEERSLTGEEKRKWVIGQAKKVYKDFKKKEALLLQDLFEGLEDQATPEQDEVNGDPFEASLLNSAQHQQPALVSQAENSGMGMAMLDNHGLECASHSFDGMHEGLALPNGRSLGSQEGSALPVSQLPPNTESGMSLNGSDQLDLLQIRVGTQQQQISLQQQQICDQQQQIALQQQQIQEFGAQILQLQHQQRIQQQQLQESRIRNPQWPYQFCFQEQQLQVINQGVAGLEVEIEESMHQQNYSGHMAPPPDGGEVQEAF